jgi:predicted nucleic acid-binding protein
MRIMLDSAFVIDHLRGEPSAVERFRRMFEDGDDPLTNEIVVCEVRAGLRVSDLPRLAAFLDPIEFVQPGSDTALQAGAWRADVRSRGRTLSLADALIASAAVANDAVVLTRNVRDFLLTPARVEEY